MMNSNDGTIVEEDEFLTDMSEPEPEIVTKPRKLSNYQDISINLKKNDKIHDTVALPSTFDKETNDVLEKAPNVDILDNVEGREWANVVSEGLENSTYGDVYKDTLSDTAAEFRQYIDTNGKKLHGQSPKFKDVNNQNLKGERATIRLVNHLGMGSLFQVPLWHSGIWVTFKPPSDTEIIELNRIMLSDKIKFGRYTYGLAFSNISVYTVNRLVDFCLSHIYDMSVKSEDINIGNIKDHINCQDIPILIWGLVCTMYPRGFNYKRACINDIEKCTNVVTETLNVFKLQWTNTEAISDWQKGFMSDRQARQKTLDEITRYKTELTKLQSKKILINKDLSNEVAFTIKAPTLSEYVTSGYKWVSGLVDNIDSSLSLDNDDDERNQYIISKGQATSMRQYIHWIESIEYGSNIIDDRETLEATLDILSSDDDVREEFIDAIVKYINESTISVIGIPSFDCPKCNKDQCVDSYPKVVDIIPLDVSQLFFDLLLQRISRLVTR